MQNDSKILELQEKIKNKMGAVNNTRRAWKTNCVIDWDSKPRNLQTISTVEECIGLFAVICAAKEAHEKACAELNCFGTYQQNSFTYEEWRADFQTRVAIIKESKEKKDLAAALNQLEALESTDLKTLKTLESLEKLFG